MEILSRLIPIQPRREREIFLPYLPLSLCTGCLKFKSSISCHVAGSTDYCIAPDDGE